MKNTYDYRDALRAVLEKLRNEQGMTWAQIAKRSGIREQIIVGVLRKERNFSMPSLSTMLNRLGYTVRFEAIPDSEISGKVTSPASLPSVPNRS
jgi:transcriptional regulator with XRE-family HTH domain